MKSKISIIIPAYNEEKSIAQVVKPALDLNKADKVLEVIVVDDGSTDSTRNIVAEFPEITLFSSETNKGKGHALYTGISAARGKIIVTLDADLTNLTSENIENMYTPIARGKAEMVKTYLGKPNMPGKTSKFTVNYIGGQRAYLKKYLEPLLPEMKNMRYRIDTFISKELAHLDSVEVELPNVGFVPKGEKVGLARATLEHFIMWPQVFWELVRVRKTKSKGDQ